MDTSKEILSGANVDPPRQRVTLGPDDGDISFQSSDGDIYKAHLSFLKRISHGLPPADCPTTPDGSYVLPESSALLNRLFYYIYPNDWPSPISSNLTLGDICTTTQAIAKYKLVLAEETWQRKLRDASIEHPLLVLKYAHQIQNKETLSHAARSVAQSNAPIIEVLEVLPQEMWGEWLCYKEEHDVVFRSAAKTLPQQQSSDCSHCGEPNNSSNKKERQLRKLSSNPLNMATIDACLKGSTKSCKTCSSHFISPDMQSWRNKIVQSLQGIPPFVVCFEPERGDSQSAPVWTSKLFTFTDSDVTICSADGVLFNLHKKVLEVCCEAFPPSSFHTSGEVVRLTESGSTLERLFQFIYSCPQAGWEDLEISELYELAEAAEKYQAHSAMAMYKILMEKFVKSDAGNVFAYSAKHGYHDLANRSALTMLRDGTRVRDFVHLLTPDAILAWARYMDHVEALCRKAISSAPSLATYLSGGGNSRCDDCSGYPPNPLIPIFQDLAISSGDALIRLIGIDIWKNWNRHIPNGLQVATDDWKNMIDQDIKAFSTFL